MAIIDVIKFDGTGEPWMIYKWPKNNITIGSQLVVHQSQEAVFFKDGMALDLFGPGTHTLNTSNIPLLQKIINLPFGGQTPFVAEVYFVNKVAKLDLLWGTTDPIQVVEPKYQIITRMRGYGQMGIRIEDSRMFISQITGALSDGAVENYDRVQRYFKGLVINGVKKSLADAVVNQKVSVFDISAKMDTLSNMVQSFITSEFKRFGVEVLNFYMESINVSEDDIAKLRSVLEQRAEFEQLGDERYTRMRTFDTLEKAAQNQGEIGGLMGAGLGLGIGLGTGTTAGSTFTEVLKQGLSPSQLRKCPACQKEIPGHSLFCNYCGAKIEQAMPAKNCPQCQTVNPMMANFCNSCGTSMTQNHCSKCQASNSTTAKFCIQCGNPLTQHEPKKGETP